MYSSSLASLVCGYLQRLASHHPDHIITQSCILHLFFTWSLWIVVDTTRVNFFLIHNKVILTQSTLIAFRLRVTVRSGIPRSSVIQPWCLFDVTLPKFPFPESLPCWSFYLCVNMLGVLLAWYSCLLFLMLGISPDSHTGSPAHQVTVETPLQWSFPWWHCPIPPLRSPFLLTYFIASDPPL